MTLRKRIGLTVAAIVTTMVVVLRLITTTVMLNGFLKIEHHHVEDDVQRVGNAFNEILNNLKLKGTDWAFWDDSYQFMKDRNKEYINANLQVESLTGMKLNVIAYFDTQGKLIHEKSVDWVKGEESILPQDFLKVFHPTSQMLHHESEKDQYSGLVMLPQGPLLFMSLPIMTSMHSGPIRGSLVFATFFGAESQARLAELTEMKLVVHEIGKWDKHADFALAIEQLENSSSVVVPVNDEIVHGYALIEDFFGKPSLVYRIEEHRDIYREGQAIAGTLLIAILIASCVLGLSVLWLMDFSVISRVSRISDSVVKVAYTNDLTQRVQVGGADELGMLSRRINGMLAALQISQRDLNSAKDLAEKASRSKSMFVANMSHEIRTPINGILGMVEVALNARPIEEHKQYLEIIRDSTNSLLGIINEVLDFSKIEAGRLELDPVDFEFDEVLKSVRNIIAIKAAEKNLDLIFDVDPAIPRDLHGDSLRLRQVLVNLLGNAIKFTRSGHVLLRVARDNRSDEEVHLTFSVEDTGIGIAADKLDSVFQAFTQADGSTTRRYGGTGLGLTISRQLVSLMEGELTVSSVEGKGSCFAFSLRFGIPSEVVLRDDPVALGRVVCFDENPTRLVATKNLLEPYCSRVHARAVSPRSKLGDSDDQFDWILMSAGVLDGLNNGSLRSPPGSPEKRVIVLVPLTRLSDARKLREQGAWGVLPTPFVRDELFALIRGVEQSEKPSSGAVRLAAQGELSKMRVLVVDDTKTNRTVAKLLLEQHGHTVTVASSGAEAIATYESGGEKPFDMILMDVQMPEMDGLEATQLIRAIQEKRQCRVPVVALTAHALASERDEFLKSGMDGYVAKPLDPKELFQVMRALSSETKKD